jgi:hypothetical protein
MNEERKLTHRLYFIGERDRWVCGCGFVLGEDGHEALYARCKHFGKDKRPVAYLENEVSKPRAKDRKHAKANKPSPKAQRQARSAGAGVSKTALDLFEM